VNPERKTGLEEKLKESVSLCVDPREGREILQDLNLSFSDN